MCTGLQRWLFCFCLSWFQLDSRDQGVRFWLLQGHMDVEKKTRVCWEVRVGKSFQGESRKVL